MPSHLHRRPSLRKPRAQKRAALLPPLPIDPIALRTRRARTTVFELPPPEDHTSIQHSLGEILSRLASHDLDHRRAGVMLYCLHIATRNLKQNQPKSTRHEHEEEGEIVEEIVHDPVLGDLAPIAEITRPKSFVANLLENFQLQIQLSDNLAALATTQQELESLKTELQATKNQPEPTQQNTPPEPTTLPTLQAVAQPSGCPILRAPDRPMSGEATISPSASLQKRHFDRSRVPHPSTLIAGTSPAGRPDHTLHHHATNISSRKGTRLRVANKNACHRRFLPAGGRSAGAAETTRLSIPDLSTQHPTKPLQDLPASADKAIDSFINGGNLRALIVDDSIVMRKVLERMLREAGLNLTELLQAANGEQALEVLREDTAASRRLDIILCDINMPVMDGVRFLECRHTENLAADVPVLVIATDACRPRVLDALAAGARGYIAKPFTVEQVKAQLTQLLQPA